MSNSPDPLSALIEYLRASQAYLEALLSGTGVPYWPMDDASPWPQAPLPTYQWPTVPTPVQRRAPSPSPAPARASEAQPTTTAARSAGPPLPSHHNPMARSLAKPTPAAHGSTAHQASAYFIGSVSNTDDDSEKEESKKMSGNTTIDVHNDPHARSLVAVAAPVTGGSAHGMPDGSGAAPIVQPLIPDQPTPPAVGPPGIPRPSPPDPGSGAHGEAIVSAGSDAEAIMSPGDFASEFHDPTFMLPGFRDHLDEDLAPSRTAADFNPNMGLS